MIVQERDDFSSKPSDEDLGPRTVRRRETSATNWNHRRPGSRVGVTKPTVAARKAKRRKRKKG